MRIQRQITQEGKSPYEGIRFKTVDLEIFHSDASQRICLTDIEVPAEWSMDAAQTFLRYYIRRTGVPAALVPVREEGVPEWLWRKVPDTAALAALKEGDRAGHETSAKQVFNRLAGMWTYWGFKAGYFDTEEDARTFHDELCAILARQLMAPNSPQWFNAGLHWAYGLTGPAQGHFHVDFENGMLRRSINAYERPQLHACFLQSVKDDLVNEGGIMHLFEREARAFKYGSGSGANMSAIRGAGEKLSGGARAQGLMKFLNVGDKAAGAISAGGLPRRAGKMVVVDIDHPDVLPFIRWKGEEQYKAAALITGAKVMRRHLTAVMAAMGAMEGEDRFSPQKNSQLAQAMLRARRAMIPERAIARVIDYARQGFTDMHIPVYSAHEDSELFSTVAAQQTHQAIRVSDRFMEAVRDNETFAARARTNGVVMGSERARVLLEDMLHSMWATGDPTLHFSDTIATRHTVPETGAVRAGTPASEYLFLDDTACPLAALNLLAFSDAKGQVDIGLFCHVVRLTTLMLDISVGVAQYPSREMARLTQATRPIGIGLANVAGLLMRLGVAYDSPAARGTVASMFALLSGEAANSSADIAKELGAFSEFTKNRDAFVGRLKKGRATMKPDAAVQRALSEEAARLWEMALIKTEAYGARNAQLTCVPPTTTIARIMDCETIGLMPVGTLLRFQRQPNGRARKSMSASASYGLQAIGMNVAQINEITRHVCGYSSLATSPSISHGDLRERGFGDAQLQAIDDALQDAPDIHAAFDPWLLGERFCREKLGIAQGDMYDASFKVLEHMGFTAEEIAAANRHACGAQTLQDAPYMLADQLDIFSAAGPAAQVAMLAAVQPYVTGGIAHTIALPHHTSVAMCEELVWEAWRGGLTSITLKREGCTLYEDMGEGIEDEENDEKLVFRDAVASVSGNISEIAAELAKRFVHTKRDLPLRRHGFTQKTTIAGQTVYLRTGEYEEGALGEFLLDLPQEKQLTRALAQHFSRAISVALQHGVPLLTFMEAFADPRRITDDMTAELVEDTHAVIDYVFAELATAYLADVADGAHSKVVPITKAKA